MTTLALALDTWQTPHGKPVTMAYREGTNDWNVIQSCSGVTDEYSIPEGLQGWALDVGAHIGAVTVPLLVDNPELFCIAIEPLPENVTLLRANLMGNGVADRCDVLPAAASNGMESVEITHGRTDTDVQAVHRYIAGADVHDGGPVITARPVSLSAIMDHQFVYGPCAWAKIDCEGCEWSFLTDPAIAHVREIVGEWHHQPDEHIGADIVALLAATHDVTLTDDSPRNGGFRAVRHG